MNDSDGGRLPEMDSWEAGRWTNAKCVRLAEAVELLRRKNLRYYNTGDTFRLFEERTEGSLRISLASRCIEGLSNHRGNRKRLCGAQYDRECKVVTPAPFLFLLKIVPGSLISNRDGLNCENLLLDVIGVVQTFQKQVGRV